jgi:Fe2+ transport system protein B
MFKLTRTDDELLEVYKTRLDKINEELKTASKIKDNIALDVEKARDLYAEGYSDSTKAVNSLQKMLERHENHCKALEKSRVKLAEKIMIVMKNKHEKDKDSLLKEDSYEK